MEIHEFIFVDLRDSLAEAFEPLSSWEEAITFSGDLGVGFESEDGRFAVASWEFEGVHIGPFMAIAGTGERVSFCGITVWDNETEQCYRSVDWTPVLAQIGVAVQGRPVHAEFANG